MRIIEKYVLKSYVSALFFCVSLLIVLGIIGDILGFIVDIFEKNIPLSSILSFYYYLAPFAFVNMLPFACILSVSYVFNNLSKNHEVTAVIASGLSLWEMLKPVIAFTFILCIATFIINDRVVPPTMQKASRIKQEEFEPGEGKGRIKNLAIYGKGEQIIFSKSYDPKTKSLENVIIHRQDMEHTVKEKFSARIVQYQPDGTWLAKDVIIFKVDANGDFVGEPEVYKTKTINIKESPEEFATNQWDPKFMSYEQLKRYMNRLKTGSPMAIKRLVVDLHYKLAFPFASLVVILICVPFSIETGRANALAGMVRGISISMLYVPVMAISMALGKGGALPPVVAAWFANVFFALLGSYYIYRKS